MKSLFDEVGFHQTKERHGVRIALELPFFFALATHLLFLLPALLLLLNFLLAAHRGRLGRFGLMLIVHLRGLRKGFLHCCRYWLLQVLLGAALAL